MGARRICAHLLRKWDRNPIEKRHHLPRGIQSYLFSDSVRLDLCGIYITSCLSVSKSPYVRGWQWQWHYQWVRGSLATGDLSRAAAVPRAPGPGLGRGRPDRRMKRLLGTGIGWKGILVAMPSQLPEAKRSGSHFAEVDHTKALLTTQGAGILGQTGPVGEEIHTIC